MRLAIDENLELRSLTVDDADEMFALIDTNRDYLAPWIPWIPLHRSVDDTRDYLARAEGASGKPRRGGAIRVNGEACGVVLLGGIDEANRLAPISYWLARSAEGKGLVTRCASALIEDGFAKDGLNRIELWVEPENTRSCAVADRLGFRREGVSAAGKQGEYPFCDCATARAGTDWPWQEG